MSHALILLPAWPVFGRQGVAPALARAFGRADALPRGQAGGVAQLARHFVTTPAPAAAAALTRQMDAGDAAGAAWLRVDPAHVRPDINGARLLGIGDRLSLSREDCDALLPALRPLFGDSGFALDAPVPARWYLRLPAGSPLPRFSDPDQALGEDLFEHQPDGAEGRRWRALLNEVQIVLHNHPWNARRGERGLVSINALWAWGGGVLPDLVSAGADRACSDDDLAHALARAAGARAQSLPADYAQSPPAADDTVLYDLRRARDLAALQRDWLLPALAALSAGTLDALTVDAADGRMLRVRRGQRWRVWRGGWSMPADAHGRDAAP